jgi:hypothetical protein
MMLLTAMIVVAVVWTIVLMNVLDMVVINMIRMYSTDHLILIEALM